MTTKIVTGTEYEIENVKADLEGSKLTLHYDLFIKGYDVFATIETNLDCYDAKEYAPDYDAFGDRRFMNDCPKISISSIDCFDNFGDFHTEVYVEIMRLVMNDYNERKFHYIWKHEALSQRSA